MLYLVGTSADVFAKRLRNIDISYPIEEIFADAASHNPTIVHRACLYLDALKLSAAEGAEPMLKAYRKGVRDKKLRHAVLRALVYTQDLEAERFLTALSKNEESDDQVLAKDLIKRRQRWMAQNQDALSETRPISVSGSARDG